MKKFAKPLISITIKEYVCIITVVNIGILAEEMRDRHGVDMPQNNFHIPDFKSRGFYFAGNHFCRATEKCNIMG